MPFMLEDFLWSCAASCALCQRCFTCSQKGLVVVDVLGGKRRTHADGKGRQRQAGQEAAEQELQLHLLLVG